MAKKPSKDSLGDRMKKYENVTRYILPPRTYTLLRVDGRAFHTWTRGLHKPYDLQLMSCMDAAAVALCEAIANTRFAFVQSDEISLLATDFATEATAPWFDGVIQKWASVSAAIAGAAFNKAVHECMVAYEEFRRAGFPNVEEVIKLGQVGEKKIPNAEFDARVFTIPDFIEVENYFIWRQKDAERNSVSMLAQHYASAKQLHGKKRDEQHEIIYAAGDNWAKHPVAFKHGRVIRKSTVAEWGKDLGVQPKLECYAVAGGNWFVDNETPVFVRDRQYLRSMIPVVHENDLIVRKATA
jgi:tRNA(His) guanylyltransferase